MFAKVLAWVSGVSPEILQKMFSYKLKEDYVRPSALDIEAQKAIIISKKSTCLFYEVGATLFHISRDQKNIHMLSDGYNGASRGDVNPRVAGCARVVDGVLKQGEGYCRGSHAELNAIGNCPVDPATYEDVRMMVTLHPCYICAKQIVNRNIKTIYYIWEYGREDNVTGYLEERGVTVKKYTSPFLERWIKVNNYHSVGSEYNKKNHFKWFRRLQRKLFK